MAEPGFEWAELYPRIAEKLFGKKDDTLTSRKELIRSVCEKIGNVPPAIAGKEDPFSFFELFGGGLLSRTLVERLTVCTNELFNEKPKLSFVRGVPAISFRSFEFNKDKNDEIRTGLWKFFAAAMNYANTVDSGGVNKEVRSDFIDQYRNMKDKNQILPTTAVVLFMMRPTTFLPLDSTTRAYLKKNFGGKPTGWPEKETKDDKEIKLPTYTAVLNGKVPSAEQYLFLSLYIKQKFGELKTQDGGAITSFAALSYEAWRTSSFAQAFELLDSNHQVILTGAPGTGKTHTAKQVAKAFVDENKSLENFKKLIPDFDEDGKDKKKALNEFFKKLGERYSARKKYNDGELAFVEKLPKYDRDKWQEKIFTARVQFHPGYDYSDFVIGMKPKIVDGKDGAKNISFRWEDGIFKAFADRARTVYDEWCNQKGNDPKEAPRFVFIIDEINRADLSRVFGELFSLLEESYRYSRTKDGEDGDEKSDENSITLPNGDEFVIPENLYIIGTMNDIDKSVESMDFALRRRFAWLEVSAEQSERIIDKWADEEDVDVDIVGKLKNAMEALNKKIRDDKKLGPEYEMGGAYFTKFGDGKTKNAKDSYERLWDNHLRTILSEYLRGNQDRKPLLDALHQKYIEECGYGKKKPVNGAPNGEQGGATA